VTAKLVEEHKGTIDVASTEGEGTTFSMRFPAQAASEYTFRNRHENDSSVLFVFRFRYLLTS
jgi:signal transduction histidine kinase